jgi:ferredoxin
MTSAWHDLAAVLDKIPNSYSPVDGDVHIKVLQWIFSEEEASLASKMKLMGETIDELHARIEYSGTPKELENLLETMAKKGQIRAWRSSTGRRYCLIPFVVGVYEEQLNRLDREGAELIEELFVKGKGGEFFSTEPAIMKVVPINRSIQAELEVYPYETAEEMIESSQSWGIRECICKKQQALLDKPCNYPSTVCIILAPKKENAFDDSELTKPISKEAALEILHESEEAGLVHCSMNIQTGHTYICNCCTCCCNLLRGVAISNQPHAFVKSNYYARIDTELCTGCETCIERCQFDALDVPEDVCVVEYDRCIGCGVCAIACPEGAIELVEKSPDEKTIPPEKVRDWMTQKAISRGVDPSELL